MQDNQPDNQLLALLVDIKQPPAMPWWPLAPGGWLLLTGLIVIAALIIYWRFYYRPLRRAALKELQRIKADQRLELEPENLAVELSQLLRRVAIAASTDKTIAGLTGYHWLAYLDQKGNTKAFTEGVGAVLVTAPYTQDCQFQGLELIELSEQWIRANT